LFSTSVYRGEYLINLRTIDIITRTYASKNDSVVRADCGYCGCTIIIIIIIIIIVVVVVVVVVVVIEGRRRHVLSWESIKG